MQQAQKIFSAAVACVALFASVAGVATAAEFSLEDRGLDGEVRLYSVHCNDGSRRLLMHNFRAGEACFISTDGEVCAPDFKLENVGKRACRAVRPDRS